MKKNYPFAFVAFVLLATSFVFAQNTNAEVVEKMTGIRGVALRTFCSFSTLFGANNTKCFDAQKVSVGNTAAVGAVGVGSPSETPSSPQAPTPTPTGNQGGQTASIGGFSVPVAPQIIERTVIVQGTPGPQGPAGAPGAPGSGATGAFVNVPQVFWNGGGGSSNPTTVISSSVSPLPSGALPGQVLTTNASGTVEWQYITIPSATNSPSVLGTLANLFATNGLNLATTSTSTTLKLGGLLTEDTTISQDLFNFGLSRSGFGIVNQGTTTVPTASVPLENTNFSGVTAANGTQTIFGGAFQRLNTPLLFEVQAFDSATNQQGYSAVGNSAVQMGVTNGTTTNQIRADFNRIRLSTTDLASSSNIEITPTTGVTFTSSEGSYSFPRMDGTFDGVMATDGLGKLRFRTLLEILSTTSTSTLAQMPLWSTTGNTGTNPTDNFIGTTDAEGFAIRTNNIERLRVASNGNVGIGTSTPMRPLTVVGDVGGTLAMFQNINAGAPAGISLQATRANNTLTERIGLFVNPNISGDDRIGFHAVGTGDLWSVSKSGDLVGSLGTAFDQRNGTIPARLSVMANDARPVAYFENGAQTYVRFVNGSGAFPQSYGVGVEAAGGTFNIIDTNANKTRLSINRNGGVQIYDRLAVGSYDFGLGNPGDAGFGRSDQAYMRYVQRAHIADPALELYDYNSQLSTRISQSSNGTPTEFNRTNKDIDFRIAGQTDNNLFFADAALNKVGIGMAPITSQPTNKLEVAGNISVRTGDKVVFENNTFADWITSSSGFNGRSLQFWTASNKRMEIDGAGNVLWNDNGTGNKTFQFRPSNGQTSDVIRMQQNPNQGSATLFSVNGLGGGYFAGNVGIGINPQPAQTLSVFNSIGITNPTFMNGTFVFENNGSDGIIEAKNLNHIYFKDTIAPLGNYDLGLWSNKWRNVLGNVFSASYGSATNPTYLFDDGSGNFIPTGMFGDASKLGLSVNGSAALTALANGNVGIGTATPVFKLDVSGGDMNIAQGFAYRYAGTPVITANPSLANFFFANSGNLTMTGRDNTAIGNNALRSNTNARDNTALGAESLKSNTTGGANTGLGQDSLRTNISGSTNVGVGVEALLWNVSGNRNIGLGVAAFADNISGSDNIAIGYEAGRGITTGSGNTIIGSNVKGLPSNLSNNIIIADGLGNRRINVDALGNVAIGTTTASHRFHVVGGGTGLINGRVARFDNASATCYINPTSLLGIQCSSDRNLKKDIASMDSTLGALTQLKPSLFRWNADDASSPLQYGFIAQEVEEVFPSFVTTDSDTGMKSVAFGNLLPVMVRSIQELNAHLGDLSKNTSTEEFAASTIFKRFSDAFKTLTVAFKNITADKATVKELCLPKSDGTVICLNGDQVALIVANTGVTIDPVIVEEEEVITDETSIDPTLIEQSPVEPTPVDESPVDETPIVQSVGQGDSAPQVDVIPEVVETVVEEALVQAEPQTQTNETPVTTQ